ncbi:MAG: tripartite tricarboxylate transporter permease [Deltaproteobacteria bacterium]|nr:tripartite tricarboxylate transporter permease [Deltaproteobacteria bacterium]
MLDMVNALFVSLWQVFTWSTFSLMLLGIVIGFAVGILPGLGGPTTLALMLPFIVKMKAVEAFAFLLGMTAVTSTTGDITSVLFGVPGEPTTASTIVDGHPMAKKGEAGRALGAVLMSSLVGALFGAFALAMAIPIIRPLVLTFGSPEFFMLAILGITFVASLSGGALLKGIIAGGMGLFLATIGMDPMSGIQRYTFGKIFLWDGIGLVPITIGFFAIPEIIDLAVQGTSIAGERVEKLGGVMEGVKDTFRHLWLVIRCSAIGTFAAIIPGMGGATTQWLAYAHAVQSSPDRERFGRGAVEGVLGPGAANNSTLGGSLVTTIAFGVPASVLMAILLGAFLIQGIVPGPDMLIPEAKGGHLSLTLSFVWTIVISNIITVVLCFLFLNQLIKITQVRGTLLIPFILLLIYLGAFAEKNIFEDMPLVIIFGALGWIMQKVKWPRPPLILGLVLGPLAENRLFLSTDNYGTSWLFRPAVLILITLTFVGALYPLLRKVWEKGKQRRQTLSSSTPDEAPARRKIRFCFSGEIVFSLAVALMFSAALWQSRQFNFRAGLFPWAIGFPVLAFTLIQLILELAGKSSAAVAEGEEIEETGLPAHIVNRRTARIWGWIIGFFAAIWLLGFSLGVVFCTLLHFQTGDREKWPFSLLLTGGAWVFIYAVFERILHVPFPPGLVFSWLGWVS